MMKYATQSKVRSDPDHDSDQIILCGTVTRSDGGAGYTVPADDITSYLQDEMQEGTYPEPKESITITFGFYTQRELDNMPEFDG